MVRVFTFFLAATTVAGAESAGTIQSVAPSLPTTEPVASRPAVTTRPAGSRSRRPAPSPLLSDREYAELAAALREAYSKPPEEWPAPTLDPGVEHRELGLMPPPPYPADNPYSEAKAELGLRLFFDPRLSGSGQIACASCHDPELGWADGRAVSYGHERQLLRRNAPSLVNTAYATSWFWDGRAASLEDQAMAVIHNPQEMKGDKDQIVRTIAADPVYPPLFREAFGDEKVTFKRITQALATYERSVTTEGYTPFDRFLRGEKDALSDAAVRGLHLFRTKARCLNCHNGPNFTDNKFHNLGLTYYGRELEDLGRYNVTKDPQDVGKFRTPSLRNVARTAPYMHNGLFDLDGVINMYDAGMGEQRRPEKFKDDPLFPVKSPHIRPLGLNQREKEDLKAFLHSLTERRRRVRVPKAEAKSKIREVRSEK